MRTSILIVIIPLGLLSCKQKKPTIQVQKDYLSNWFIQNEDSLYSEFSRLVKSKVFDKIPDSTWGSYAFENGDTTTFMGQFTHLTKKYCDSLQVTFIYTKSETPHETIELSTGYNKSLTTALDTIFNFVPKPKHFTIEKYEQPDINLDGFGFPNLNINNKDLRIKMQQRDGLQDLTVRIYSKNKKVSIRPDDIDFLKKELFGEELLLKKIGTVEFIITDILDNNLLTLKDVRARLL